MHGSKRNDPNIAAAPKMIPWENMGQVAMQRAALNVKKLQYMTPQKFVEEETKLAAGMTTTKVVNIK